MRGWLVPVAIGLVTSASTADAARITGRVRVVGHEPIQASVDPYPAQLGSMAMQAAPTHGAPDVALELTARSSSSTPPAPRRAKLRMAQQGQAFEPRVLAIPVGTVVEFPNFDPVFHNVFSYSKTKRFDLGRYGKGSSKSVTFDQPGIVKVFCDIHSNMSGFIYVASSPWVTQPREDGRYSFENVPPGSYQLRIWHPERGETSRNVEVGTNDQTLDIEL